MISAFGEVICIVCRKPSELLAQSDGLQVDCLHSGWDLETDSSSIKPSALCLVVIKASISNLMKCYERNKESDTEHYYVMSKSMVCPYVRYCFISPSFHLKKNTEQPEVWRNATRVVRDLEWLPHHA